MRESARFAWWLLVLLFSLAIGLNFALLVWLMKNEPPRAFATAESVEISLKIALARGTDPMRNPELTTIKERLGEPVWEAQILKAIFEAYIGADSYRETLLEAQRFPAESRTPAQRRWYTALLQQVLAEPQDPQQIPEILNAFQPVLSPFSTDLIGAVLYQRAGDSAKAEQIRSRVQRVGISLLLLFGSLVGIIGLGSFLGLGVLLWFVFHPPRFRTRPFEEGSPFALDPILWALVLFMLTIMISPAEFLQSFLKGFGISAPAHSILNQLFASAIALAFLQTVRTRLGQGIVLNWFPPLGFWKQVQAVVVGALAYIPIAVAGILIVVWLAPNLSSQRNPIVDTALESVSWFQWVLIFVQAVVLAPVIEEFVFRGVLFQVLWQRTGRVWLSALVSGFLFAIVHSQFLAGLIPLTAIGTVMALVYAHTRSLMPAILLHMLNNLAVTLFLLVFSL